MSGTGRDSVDEMAEAQNPGAVIPPDGTAGVTGFAADNPVPEDVDPQDPDLEGGLDSEVTPSDLPDDRPS